MSGNDDGDLIKCWCGAEGTFEELFSNCIDTRCGGIGVIYCYCGGDFCVCHNHGSIDCDGCVDCQSTDDDEDYVHWDPDL